LDRDVAIKVLPDRLANDPAALARFEREAKAIAALSHPNILAVHDVGRHEGISYVVMELLEGETLRSRITRSALSPRKTLEVGIALADGLAAAHAKGVIHRDLKPENIFLTADSQVKILDFGLARSTGSAEGTTHDLASSPTLTIETTPGAIMGTLCYMAPEQVRGLATDTRTDIFAFGCVMYEMLTGQRAFLGETAADTMTAILREEPKSLRTGSWTIGPEIEQFIDRCLEKRPEQRFQSSTDLAFSLRSIQLHAGQPTVVPSRFNPWSMFIIGAAAVVALTLLAFWGLRRDAQNVSQEGSGARETIDSLAILPFVNAGGDPEQEYFVDGMTEALIANLAKIRALKVISRTSVMRYKASTKTLPEIARELKVEAVVEGSVLQVGERVRITVELIHAATDNHLWAETYERDLRDVLRLHSEVASAIAHEIQVTLTPQEAARMIETRSVNPEAHQAYLKGRFHWNKRTPDGVMKALEYFEQAISLAPDWPLGYLGLADTYVVIPQYGSMPPKETMPKARAAATRALELDESLGEAHATLGLIAEDFDWDWPAAEREFQRALALSPNYATAHHWYALYLMHTGRYDEAVKEMLKAQELDPLSLIIGSVVGMAHWCAGDLEEAERAVRKTLEFGPDYPMAHANLAIALFLQGRPAEAIVEIGEAARLSNNAPNHASFLAYMSAKGGQPEEARRILNEFTARSKETYVAPTLFARAYAGLSDNDRAFEWLEKAYEERDAWLLNVLIEPHLVADLRGDPRFADLLRRVGLPLPAPSELKTAKSPAGRIMLAVLPFENLSGDPDQEYFSDGMTEELISQLGRMNPDKLQVIGRTSSMQYKKTSKKLDQIGRELNVDYLVEGSVRRAADRVRITTQLVEVDRQARLWGDAFDRELTDILALQGDVALAIARQINVKLIPQEQARLAATRVVNPAAHEAYTRGRFEWNYRSPTGLENAIEYFGRAIEIDPNYAPAYSGLADTYTALARYGYRSPKEALPLAKQAALKAVEIDDGSAEAHAALAYIAFFLDWDWVAAERELRRALDLNPSNEEAHHQYSHLFMTLGRPDDSIIESRRALELNPLDPLLKVHMGWHYMMTRQYDRAITQLNSVLEADPNHFQALLHIGWTYTYRGLHAEAIAKLEARHRLSPDNAQALAALAAAYAAGGRAPEARAILEQLEGALPQRYVSACDIAAVYAALQESDVALQWLEKAFAERSPRMVELGVEPIFDPLRTDPRFVDLVRRVGLPDVNAGNPQTNP